MKYSYHLVTLAIFTCALGLLIAVSSSPVNAVTDSFTVTLDISNVAPTITYVDTAAKTPVADSTANIQFLFNASDTNGASDLNTSTASVVIALGEQTASSTGCTVESTTGDEQQYNCTVPVPYYFDASSSWSINASIQDNSGTYDENTSETFTINELKAIALTEASLSFSGTPGSEDVAANEGAQRVRNTGNFDFTELNITGYDLEGDSSSDIIQAGNFSVNTTNSATGQALMNATAITISGADMTHGQNANETVYVYLDVPASAQADTYNSVSNWVIEAN